MRAAPPEPANAVTGSVPLIASTVPATAQRFVDGMKMITPTLSASRRRSRAATSTGGFLSSRTPRARMIGAPLKYGGRSRLTAVAKTLRKSGVSAAPRVAAVRQNDACTSLRPPFQPSHRISSFSAISAGIGDSIASSCLASSQHTALSGCSTALSIRSSNAEVFIGSHAPFYI